MALRPPWRESLAGMVRHMAQSGRLVGLFADVHVLSG